MGAGGIGGRRGGAAVVQAFAAGVAFGAGGLTAGGGRLFLQRVNCSPCLGTGLGLESGLVFCLKVF